MLYKILCCQKYQISFLQTLGCTYDQLYFHICRGSLQRANDFRLLQSFFPKILGLLPITTFLSYIFYLDDKISGFLMQTSGCTYGSTILSHNLVIFYADTAKNAQFFFSLFIKNRNLQVPVRQEIFCNENSQRQCLWGGSPALNQCEIQVISNVYFPSVHFTVNLSQDQFFYVYYDVFQILLCFFVFV